MSKHSALLDTRVVYCGDNLEQLAKLPDGCVDLVSIDPPPPPFNSNRNYEVFWGETKERRSFEGRQHGDVHRRPAAAHPPLRRDGPRAQENRQFLRCLASFPPIE